MELIKNLKSEDIFKKLFIVLAGSILLAISSKIKIPFYPVPMTMQTFVVLMIGIAFGWRLGVTTILLYLFEGLIGLPVFSGSPEKGVGIVYFTGPTMGYLIGFVITAFIAGKLNYGESFLLNFLKIVFAISFIYIFGILWLGYLIGWEKPIFKLGVQPFLLAELFKVILITILINQITKIRKLI